jgi:putative transposase
LVKRGEIKSVRAEALGINRKNIYRESKLESKDIVIKAQITEAHKIHPAYGQKRLGWHLKINAKRIRRIMKKYGIKVPRRKIKNAYCTKSVKHKRYENLIKEVKITNENQLWCSDTSRFIFHGSKWYIVTVIDIFTRQVLGVAIGRHHDSALVLEAIEMALIASKAAPAIFHTDQGTEFMAEVCTSFLENRGIKVSASDKASPWQNGYQESFFGKFKDDVGDINRFEIPGELLEALYHAIHYYNNERIHTALKMPPAVYAKEVLKNKKSS